LHLNGCKSIFKAKGSEKMEKRQISESYYFVKTRDRVGGTIRTNVFTLENGSYIAYSSYAADEDGQIVGAGESTNDETAIKLSRKDLRKEWKAEKLNC
jgi:hypothetical protein